MAKTQPSDNQASDSNKYLSTDGGQLIELDTPAFLNWLEANDSFRFNAGVGGENSYRARKEKANYWYAVKKVKGKLHKRFIGKSEQVTHNRLIEVAQEVMQPSKPRNSVSDISALNHSISALNDDTLQPDNNLQNQIDELRQLVLNQGEEVRQLRQLVLNSQTVSPNLEEENQELHNKVVELTIQLDNIIVNHENEVRQLRERIDQLETEKRNLQQPIATPDYEAIRDRILAKLKVGGQSSAGKAVDAFIKELLKTHPATVTTQKLKE